MIYFQSEMLLETCTSLQKQNKNVGSKAQSFLKKSFLFHNTH